MNAAKAPEACRQTTNPSALAAALAQAVLEQHAKRAGLVAVVMGNVGDMVITDAPGQVNRRVSGALSRLRAPVLTVIEGGRRAQTEP